MKLSANVLTVLVVAFSLLMSCLPTKEKDCGDSQTREGSKFRGYVIGLGQLSPDNFRQIIKDSLEIVLTDENFSVCPCDQNLAFLHHSEIVIDGHGPVQVKTETRAAGLDITYAKNFILENEESKFDKAAFEKFFDQLKQESQGPTFENPFVLNKEESNQTYPPNTIAIFDAGLNSYLSSLEYKTVLGLNEESKESLCQPEINVPLSANGRLLGVNHIRESGAAGLDYAAIWDNTDSQHGVTVAYLIASQRINRSDINPVRILSMRVLNNSNQGDLFSLMCAMSQAKRLGAKIFNLSLGYYGPESEMFRKYIESLAFEKIWVVTAAGNAIDRFDAGESGLPVNRDLTLRPEESKFYPAYFARNMDHVIAVTSIASESSPVCDRQNYGRRVVDVGVVGQDCGFEFPHGSGNRVVGTSFATPIVSGWIATRLNLGSFDNKNTLLNDLDKSVSLGTQIKGGRYIKANTP